MKMINKVSIIETLNKTCPPFFKIILFLFLTNSCFVFAQPYIKTTSGIGQYGYLEKDASTTMLLNSGSYSNIYQLFGRTFLNGTNILTYPGTAVNDCTAATNIDQNTNNYAFGANAIPGLIAYTSVHADYCFGGGDSYGGNPNQTGSNERQHYIFDVSDRPSDVASNVIQLNPGAIVSPYNVVMSVKIDFGSVSSRVLQRFWIQNTGTLAENSEIANDGFKLYYEPATGSETFDGTESNATIYGDYAFNPTNNNIYGHDNLSIAIPSGGLRVYVVLSKFASCVSTAKTVQVSLLNDGLSFTPKMDTLYDLARVGQTPAAPALLNVSYANITSGPLGGTYYIPSVCFPTVASAVAALNANGVNAATTFNVLAGYSETATVGGFNLTATGTSTNTITFKKFGTGANPTFTAPAQSTGTLTDAIFKIIGGDYITIDGFTMQERSFSPTGTDTTPATNTMTEFGVAMLVVISANNGAKNNTIQNCTISLNKTYTNTFGIYSSSNHHSTAVGTTANTSNLTGANSNNKIYKNTISNINIGIAMIGTNGFEDSGNDIGGASLATGNTITDQGNTTVASSYLGLPGTSTIGILVAANTGSNISYNSITGNASPVNSYGIYLRSNASPVPTITHTSTISYNTIQVSCSSNNTSSNLVGILNDMGGTNHTLNITNNTIQNSTTTSTSFGGGFGGIWSKGAVNTINVNNNFFTNNTIKGSTLDSTTSNRSSFVKITNVPTVAITVSGNTINTNSFQNSGGGDIVVFDINGNYTSTCSVSGNILDVLSAGGTSSVYCNIFAGYSGATTVTGNSFKNISNTGSGSFYGTYISTTHSGTLGINSNIYQDISLAGVGSLTGYTDSQTSSGALTISGNTFKNISNSVCSSGSWIRFVNSNTGTSQVLNINSNIIDNLTLNPATTNSGVTAIYTSISNNVTIYSNSIKNVTSAGPNVGIQTSGGSGPHNVYGNTIDGMSSSVSGAIAHYGLYISPTSGTSNVYNNKVYNVTSGTSTSAAITGISAGNGTTCNVYNNMVGDLKMPSVTNSTTAALKGINMSPAANIVYNNSVYLNAVSSGTDFSSTALMYSGTGSIDLRNNILVNNSTPKGVGYSAAIMKTAAGTNGTVPTPYSSTSNNNCLYAPSVTNGVIYVEGQYTGGGPTNVYPANCTDLNLFKTFVSTRETNSFSEIPPFISTTAGSMDLHLNTAASSGCFDGGTTVAIASPDLDGNARPIGAAYEIGADEANGTNSDKTPPVIAYTPISDVGCSSTTTLTATITDANAIGSGANAPRLYYKKLSDATNTIATVNNNTVNGWKYVVATGTYTFTLNYALLPGGLVQGDVIQYFVAAQDVSGNVATTSATVTPCVTSVVFTSAQTVSSPPTINQFTYRASISGPYTVGTGSGQNYPTLSGTGGLFEAINNGYVTGNITATVTSNTVETGAVALNEWTEYNSGTCSLTGTTVYRLTVQSDGSVRTLEGTNLVYNATSLKAMINLNGADRVTFTGGTTTQRNLVFRTTNTAATSCVPVFQMGNGNGSNDIIINNCNIQTNGTSGAAPISAGIYVTGTGTNANNLFQLNDIHDAVSGTIGNPRYGVFAENNTATVLQIKDNNIYNISSKAIQLGVSSIGNGQIVTGNSIYYTGGTTINSFSGIEINASTSSSGHTISNNYIGGTSANGGTSGSKWTNSTIITFRGIYIATNGTASTTTISNNVIGNLNLSNTTGVSFSGIDFTGKVDCNNNTIGHATDSAMGIIIGASSATATSNNYGIIGGTGTAVAGISFSNNKVKFITHNTSNTGVSRLFGIYNYYTGAAGVTITISGNTVSDLTSTMKGLGNLYGTGSSANSLALVLGILSGTSATSSIDISDNIIYNLANTGVTGTNQPGVLGIGIDGSTTNILYRNKIYGLSNQSPGSAANSGTIVGIRILAGISTVANNMITITNGVNTNASRIVGIWDFSSSNTVHFNSIVIGGSQSAFGTTGICSAAYACLVSATSRSFLNNILINTRTTTAGSPSGTNYHYALAIPTTVTAFTSNYNDLVAGDLTKLCLYNTTSYAIAGWKALATPATPDVNSIAITPTFTDTANGDLHIVTDSNCSFDNKGVTVTITTDFDVPLITRANPPDIGADEFTNDFKLTITNPSVLKCTVSSVDLTASGITTGGAGSTTGATLTYWTDAGATSVLGTPSSVSTEGTYYIKSVKGSCNDIKPVIVAKQGTTWVGGAWVGSGGYPNGTLPDIETAVVIDDNYDTSVNGSFEACSLTVNSSSTLGTACTVTVKPGGTDDGYITIENDLTVNTNGSLLIENKGSLIMNNDSGVVTNNGTTQVKRTTTPFEKYDYVYWSMPLNDTRTLSNIFSGWRTDYSFTFRTQNFADISPVDTFDDNGDAWQFAGPAATMIRAKGYAMMTPTSVPFSPSATPVTVTFSGAANNGVIPIKIYESANTSSAIDDYNFIGNPYPSAVWGKEFITDNGTKTSGTLYFWTHVADISISNPGPGVYNFITADYALFNLSGGTASGTGSAPPTGYIASGQGFFVEAQNDNVDVEFNNSMRKRDPGYTNGDFFRTSNTGLERDRLWLNLQNPDGLFSQLLVGYFEETTLGYDWAYDGRVNASNTQVSFYSLADQEKYKIQARPVFSDNDLVPLGYFSIANGEFTISLAQKEGVFETDQNIYLEDKEMNIIHNLKQSPYTFTTNYGRYENRFVLRYTDVTLSNPDFGNLNNSVVIATNHGEIAIKSLIETIQEVTVFDILGRQLFQAKNIGSNNFVTSDISMSQQALIVKIKLESGTIITRKIVL